MKFTQIPTTAMEEMQLNAGVLLSSCSDCTSRGREVGSQNTSVNL